MTADGVGISAATGAPWPCQHTCSARVCPAWLRGAGHTSTVVLL